MWHAAHRAPLPNALSAQPCHQCNRPGWHTVHSISRSPSRRRIVVPPLIPRLSERKGHVSVLDHVLDLPLHRQGEERNEAAVETKLHESSSRDGREPHPPYPGEPSPRRQFSSTICSRSYSSTQLRCTTAHSDAPKPTSPQPSPLRRARPAGHPRRGREAPGPPRAAAPPPPARAAAGRQTSA